MKKLIYSTAIALSAFVILVFIISSCKKKSSSSSSSSSSSTCSATCLNGGTCVNNACNCPDGYSGASCETYYTTAYIGTYSTNSFNCTGGATTPMTFVVSLDANDKSKLNFGAFYGTLTDKTHFTIPAQTIPGGLTLNGSGAINGTLLTISYTSKLSASGINITTSCSGTLTKQ